MSSLKTIQICLPNGDPRGIRTAELTTGIVQVIEVPRSLLADFFKMPQSHHVAVYFLIGEADEGELPTVYIGQTGDLHGRLKKHNLEKPSWQRALVLISRTQSLTQTHATFLEWHSIQATRKAGRYADENGNSGSTPHTPAPLEADCLEIFEIGHTLLATLGYPLFDPLAAGSGDEHGEEVFYCKASEGVDGRGLYTTDGFVVLKGSIGRKENAPYAVGTSIEKFRLQLVEAGVMHIEGESVVFQADHLFKSPTRAGQALLGRNCNGWMDWKDKDGRTLDEVKRQETD